jgi:cell wall-associated NlpC family hydrolase
VIVASLLPCVLQSNLETLAQDARSAKIYSKPIAQRIEFFAKQLLGTPYVGATLDQQPDKEQCTVLLDGLDCVTFMETALNLARTPNPTTSSLRQSVTATRYWNGRVRGYLSRLHYTSDWFFENDRRGVVKDLSKSLPGAQIFTKKVGYMSSNPSRYASLTQYPDLITPLRQIEARSNARTKWFIPLAALKKAESQLQTGDIIALCGGVEGIDCTHVGLIIKQEGVPHFVHASSTKKQVVFDKRLSEYLAGSKSTIGIMVARPLENLKLPK